MIRRTIYAMRPDPFARCIINRRMSSFYFSEQLTEDCMEDAGNAFRLGLHLIDKKKFEFQLHSQHTDDLFFVTSYKHVIARGTIEELSSVGDVNHMKLFIQGDTYITSGNRTGVAGKIPPSGEWDAPLKKRIIPISHNLPFDVKFYAGRLRLQLTMPIITGITSPSNDKHELWLMPTCQRSDENSTEGCPCLWKEKNEIKQFDMGSAKDVGCFGPTTQC